MPAKAPIDENVKFLFACLIRSDYKTIDFTRVAADFSINPAAARMRWSRLKKTINVDDIASSILDGKKRRMSKAGPPPPSSVKVEEKFEDGASQLPPPTSSSSSSAAAAGIILKEEEEKEGEVALQEESAPLLFAGLPKPPKFKRPGAEEQVSIPVVDEATGTTGRFPVTHVPHLPRVAEATAVEAPETKSQLTAPQKHLLASAVQVPSTVKSEPEPHLEEEEEEKEGKPMKSEPPPTDTIRKNACSAIAAVLTAKGSKKRKVEST